MLLLSTLFFDKSNQDVVDKVYHYIHMNFEDVPELKLSELNDLIQNDQVQLLDVRSAEERRVSAISGAISKYEYESGISQLKNKKVVVYCTIGYRSSKYVQKLREKGVDAYNLKGSILSWVNSGHSVVNSQNKAVKRVHVYSRFLNYLPEDYVAEW